MAKLHEWLIPFRSVDWARTTTVIILLSQVTTLRSVFCNQLCTVTMKLLIQHCLNVREPRCSGFRPFVNTHFNIIVSIFWVGPTKRSKVIWQWVVSPHSPGVMQTILGSTKLALSEVNWYSYFVKWYSNYLTYTGWSKSLWTWQLQYTQLMSWRWPSQNTSGMWTVLYWTRSSKNTVRRVNKCLETGGGHFEYYL